MSDHKFFKLKNIEDLKRLPAKNTIKFDDGPMKGTIAGLKINGHECNLWIGEQLVNWNEQDIFCEKIIVKIRDSDSQLISITPYSTNVGKEEHYTSLLYVLVDGGYKIEPHFLRTED